MVAKEYTFAVPPYPEAKVEMLEQPETGVPLYDASTGTTTGETADLEAEYTFTLVEPTELQLAYYGSWFADYRISLNRDVKAESFGLYGAYNGYGQELKVGFLFPTDLKEGDTVNLLSMAGYSGSTGVTYNDIVNVIQSFTCGVWNTSTDNIGKTIKVGLFHVGVVDDNGIVKVTALDKVHLQQGHDFTHEDECATRGNLIFEA